MMLSVLTIEEEGRSAVEGGPRMMSAASRCIPNYHGHSSEG
jgi:hypothetical protein